MKNVIYVFMFLAAFTLANPVTANEFNEPSRSVLSLESSLYGTSGNYLLGACGLEEKFDCDTAGRILDVLLDELTDWPEKKKATAVTILVKVCKILTEK